LQTLWWSSDERQYGRQLRLVVARRHAAAEQLSGFLLSMAVPAAPSRRPTRACQGCDEQKVNAYAGRAQERRQDEVFEMLAKAGRTMWTRCQGVKSGRLPKMIAHGCCRARARLRRHDGDRRCGCCPLSHSTPKPGTQRSEQTLRRKPSPRSAPAEHTVPVA